MDREDWGPGYRNALWESFVLLANYVAALVYTIVYSYVFGYDRDPATVVTYWGVPDWVLWGVFAPWACCVLVTIWFSFFYMADDDLEPPDSHTAGGKPMSPGSTRSHWTVLTFLVDIGLVYGMAVIAHRISRNRSFVKEYFLGSRSLGTWTLALTSAATSADPWLQVPA